MTYSLDAEHDIEIHHASATSPYFAHVLRKKDRARIVERIVTAETELEAACADLEQKAREQLARLS